MTKPVKAAGRRFLHQVYYPLSLSTAGPSLSDKFLTTCQDVPCSLGSGADLGLGLELLLGDAVQLLVGVVQLQRHLQPLQQVLVVLLPQLLLAPLCGGFGFQDFRLDINSRTTTWHKCEAVPRKARM